jgi:hypothetical protein
VAIRSARLGALTNHRSVRSLQLRFRTDTRERSAVSLAEAAERAG